MNSLVLLRPVRPQLAAAVVLQILAAALALLPVLALVVVAASWLEGRPAPSLVVLISAVVGTVLAVLCAAAAGWLTHRADARLTGMLRRRLTDVIRRAPLPVVTGRGAARLRTVVHSDTDAIHYLVAHTLLDVTTLVVAPLVGVVALAIVDVRLAVLSIVPLALGVFWYVRAMRGSGAKFAEYATQQQAISAAVVDFVAGLPTAKLAGAAGGIRTRYAAAVNGFHDFFRAWSRSTAAVTTASWLVVAPGLTAGVFALIGGAGVLAGWMSPTALVAGVLLGPAVSAPVAVGGPRLQAIRTGLSALGSISDMLDEPPLRWADEDPPPRGAPAALDGVTVRFGDRTALDDVSFTLPQRGMVALVGASGGGKSTVAALLARFLDPDAGRVSLDGVTLDRLRESDLYERVAFVFQDTAQRVTTVRDALSGGRAVPGEELVAAAQAAAVHETILALPDGYDTVLGDDTELSSGQRQRIALARALVRDADLLVLDETLSALDATTRSAVLDTLRSQARDRAVLLIAHQLHVVAGVPRILVLDGGRLVGDGSHDDLLDGCPAYRALWNARESASRGDRR